MDNELIQLKLYLCGEKIYAVPENNTREARMNRKKYFLSLERIANKLSLVGETKAHDMHKMKNLFTIER